MADDVEYSGIGFKLTADDKSALSSLDKIISRLNSLKTAVTGGGIQKGLESIGTAISNLKGMTDTDAKNIAKTANALSKLRGISISDNVAANLSAIAQAAKGITSDDIKHIDSLSKAMSGFSALQGVSAAAIKAAKSGKVSKVADATKDLTEADYKAAERSADPNSIPTPDNRPSPDKPKDGGDEGEKQSNQTKQKSIDLSRILANTLTNELSKAARAASGAFKDLAKSMGSFMASAGRRTWDYLTGGIRNFAGGIGNLVNQIRRVAVYRLLRTVVKDLGAALNEGIQNLYQWSLAVDQSFANAMNSISTSGAYIRNSVAAMVAPLLESLAPALDWIASKIVAVMNLINQLFSLLTGRGYWTKATKQATQFAKAATGGLGSGGAGGAAKKLKEELDLIIASFDELHLLAKETDKDTGSGGGGGGGGGGAAIPDYAGMFENMPFDERLKALIDAEDWFGLGAYFAEKLNVITDAADKWIVDVFTPWAQKFAYAVGEVINGFVATYRWDRLGETVAHGMMAIVNAMYTFYTTVDWLAVGDAFGTAVRSWFETMDWIGVSNYFAAKMNAAIETAKGFVLASMRNGTDFGQGVADAVANWFRKVKWNDLATALIHGFNWAVNALVAWTGSNEMWASIEAMFEQFARAINGVDIEGLADSLGNALVRALDTMRESGFLSAAGKAIGRFLSELPWGDLFLAALKAAASAIAGAFSGFFEGSHGKEIAGLMAGALVLKLGSALALEFAKEGFKLIVSNALKGSISSAVTTATTGFGAMLSGALTSALKLAPIVLPIYLAFKILGGIDEKLQGEQNRKMTQQGQSNVQSFESQYGDSQTFINTHGLDEYIAKMQEVARTNQMVADNFDDNLNHINKSSSDNWGQINSTWQTGSNTLATNNATAMNGVASTTAGVLAGITSNMDTETANARNRYSINLDGIVGDTASKWNTITSTATTGASTTASNVISKASEMRSGYGTEIGKLKSNNSTSFGDMLKTVVNHMRDMLNDVTKQTAEMSRNGSASTESLRKAVADKMYLTKTSVTSVASALAGSMNINLGRPRIQLPDISAYESASSVAGVTVPKFNVRYLTYASGGFPDSSIFLANEAGNPEMVGKIGNRPAVANNDQIVSAVSQGVAQAVAQVMNRGNSGEPFIVNVDGKQLFDILVTRNNEQVAMTGESPLLI